MPAMSFLSEAKLTGFGALCQPGALAAVRPENSGGSVSGERGCPAMIIGCGLKRLAERDERLVAERSPDQLHSDRQICRRRTRRDDQGWETQIIGEPHETGNPPNRH